MTGYDIHLSHEIMELLGTDADTLAKSFPVRFQYLLSKARGTTNVGVRLNVPKKNLNKTLKYLLNRRPFFITSESIKTVDLGTDIRFYILHQVRGKVINQSVLAYESKNDLVHARLRMQI